MRDTQRSDWVAYACDVGGKGNFAWARASRNGPQLTMEGNTSMNDCVEALQHDIGCRAVAIGMECPEFIPIPDEATQLGRGRKNEKDRSCFASVGASVATLGLHQLAFILKKIHRRQVSAIFNPAQWQFQPDQLLFWEAFVSKQAHSKEHLRDAATAASAFMERMEAGRLASDVFVEEPAEVLSLVGCAVLWAGWSGDLALLRQAVVVVKPDRQYRGEIRVL
ncbi:MAG: hypothetical protein ACE5IP_12010 [Terriglobia bacterium]